MDRQKKIRLDKILLSLSGMAFFLIAVPSWVPGMCCALLGSALWFFVVGRSSLPDGKSLEIFTRPGALLAGTVLLGGVKSIARVCGALVPFMAIFYVIGCCYILCVNHEYIIPALNAIFKAAFSTQAAGGGFIGSTIIMATRVGIARGLFSNE